MDQQPHLLKRQDHDPPAAIAEWGWRYHHLGVPTEVAHEGEHYLKPFKSVCFRV